MPMNSPAADRDHPQRLIALVPAELESDLGCDMRVEFGEAPRCAAGFAPRVVPYLLDKRIARPPLHDAGVTMDSPDRGRLYPKAMRSEGLRTPGELDPAARRLR